ncbi:YlcI/YnfO family protein [Pseudoxanthomonas dokdonensis]|uniref:Prevent-host-death protein n=1 Tax=Pseudoxanthomonas dokdonensis TaxID=344882 RepID=A0A0R0CJT5_9GAMM|nr:YlcI/YnfO family protein [Pseudoxanthomonas dokdonensis]KRG69861.1 hypothetical protein ABB29_08570 [Pseudoxanthomonas dokdonensis]
MKSATLPSLRVSPALREAAESVLEEGETLSSFVESSVQAQISHRQAQATFLARGLAAREHAQMTGRYVSSASVLHKLEGQLDKARQRLKK